MTGSPDNGERRTERAPESDARRGKRVGRTLLRAAVIAGVAVLLIGGTLVGRAVRDLGCGHGERAVLMERAPRGGARVTFSEDALKDTCVATYVTAATSVEVLAHHEAQLAAQGWRVKGPFLAPWWDPPYLSAHRGAFSVDINVVSEGGEHIVQLSAAYHT